jgi:hypothetical protein
MILGHQLKNPFIALRADKIARGFFITMFFAPYQVTLEDVFLLGVYIRR